MLKLLFTGASGFLGKNICPVLSKNYDLKTLGIENYLNYSIDITKKVPDFVDHFDIVIHAAGKAHASPRNRFESEQIININLQGTINLCRALENRIPHSFIFISTVAVYGLELGNNIDETFPLRGNSAYALSKIKAEEFLIQWCIEHDIVLTILRPSLIAGPNPPGNLGAMVEGIKSGKYFRIGEGSARKSILMVQDIAKLIPLVIEKGGIYNVCDSYHPSFKELEVMIADQLNKPAPKSLPYSLAKLLAVIGDFLGSKAPISSSKLEKITNSLTFSNEKAKIELGWKPLSVLDNFVIQ